ncbi:hypothetical protein KM1_130230 [Entamoeba histolytica HM-3:IMSS]|nr:hypothetical protein KM1_130230 [Entamoeba histolytica HM-3:IMSS]
MNCLEFLRDIKNQMKEDLDKENIHLFNSIKLKYILPQSLIRLIQLDISIEQFEQNIIVYDSFSNKTSYLRNLKRNLEKVHFTLIQCGVDWIYIKTLPNLYLNIITYVNKINDIQEYSLSLSQLLTRGNTLKFGIVSFEVNRIFVI